MKDKHKRSYKSKKVTIKKESLTTLYDLTVDYGINYQSYYQLIGSDEPIHKEINGQMCTSKAAVDLGLDLQKNLRRSLACGAEILNKNLFCSDSVILHIKMTILLAQLSNDLNNSVASFSACENAINFLKRFHHLLNYGNDTLFQQQAEFLFTTYLKMPAAEPSDEKDLNRIKLQTILLREAVRKNYGNTIVKLRLDYSNFIDSFIHNQNILTETLSTQSKDFFALVSRVELAINSMRIDRGLPIDFQIYSIEKNLYMMIVSDLTHSKGVWKAFYMQASVCFLFETSILTIPVFKNYFSHWQSLKKDYIEPSFLLIKNINISEFVYSIDMVSYLIPLLSRWLYEILRAIELFKTWTEDQLKVLEKEDILKSVYWKEIVVTVMKLDDEINFLGKMINAIDKFTIDLNESLSRNRFKTDVIIANQVGQIYPVWEQLKKKIESLRSKIESQVGKQVEESKKKSSELLEAEKNEKAKRDLKILQRHP
ncbi:MAG: hypothetical protein H0U73_13435, partial [Tatlockia sp.]|nr:hypothetical protein [Tatlockia sp.]